MRARVLPWVAVVLFLLAVIDGVLTAIVGTPQTGPIAIVVALVAIGVLLLEVIDRLE